MSEVRARVGARLRALRLERNVTQEELAERAGLSYKFIGEMERGSGNPSLDTLERVSVALDVDVADLLSRPPKSGDYPRRSRELSLVREALRSLETWLTEDAPAGGRRRARRRPKL